MRLHTRTFPRLPVLLTVALGVAAILAPNGSTNRPLTTHAVVGFHSNHQLAQALSRFPGAKIVRRLPHMKTVEVELPGRPEALDGLPGIAFSQAPRARTTKAEPALAATLRPGIPFEWQYLATRENEVPADILRAASALKIGIVDTGADVTHPDLSAKSPETWDVVHHRTSVADKDGHGTFVASLAAGSVTNGEGIAGFGGDAQLLMVKAVGPPETFTDVDEAEAIVYAVDRGAKIVNLSLGGVGSSELEERAIHYAAEHDVLLVAAAGNEYADGNPVEYPAAALQPPGSNGQGGVGLSVGASTMAGKRASFSNTGSHISLAAPGDNVFGAIAAGTSPVWWPRTRLHGSRAGLYGWSSGTSFSTPEVAGAAALVWAANQGLTAQQVAAILKSTASGKGRWSSRLGFGVIDVAAAVAAARGQQIAPRVTAGSWLILRKVGIRQVRSSRSAGRRPLRALRVAVHLRTSATVVTPDYRTITLQVRRHRRWHRLARQATHRGGEIRWTVGLPPGRYVLRAVYRGRWDLHAAIRLRPVRVR
jgi:subtilisin family serine protease